MFSIAGVGSAFVPHHACACGQYEDGLQLTTFINFVSVKLIGRKIVETNPKPSL